MSLVSFRGADFTSADNAFAGYWRLDTDGDGVGDGVQLGLAATTVTRTFTVSGDSLVLRFRMRVNAGGEEVAVDSFELRALA